MKRSKGSWKMYSILHAHILGHRRMDRGVLFFKLILTNSHFHIPANIHVDRHIHTHAHGELSPEW